MIATLVTRVAHLAFIALLAAAAIEMVRGILILEGAF